MDGILFWDYDDFVHQVAVYSYLINRNKVQYSTVQWKDHLENDLHLAIHQMLNCHQI